MEAVPDVDEVEGRPVDEEDGEGEDLFGEAMEEYVALHLEIFCPI